jgi:hypothetical protein
MKATRFESVGAALICLILALSGRAPGCENLHAGLRAGAIYNAPRIVCIDAHPQRSWRAHHHARLGSGRHTRVYRVGPRHFINLKAGCSRAVGLRVTDGTLWRTVRKHVGCARKRHVRKHGVEKMIVVRAW